MRSDQDTIMERMTRWAEGLEQFDLPDWDSLPQLDLYMDQVILLLTRYLTPIDRDAEEKFVTASIINNYVRMRVIPPPVKKRYSRIHLAYLVVICTLKQSLSISCIQRLLPEDRSEEAVRQFYDGFVRQYRRSTAFLRRLLLTGGVPALTEAGLPPKEGTALAAAAAIFSTLSKSLTEFLLQDPQGAEEDDED